VRATAAVESGAKPCARGSLPTNACLRTRSPPFSGPCHLSSAQFSSAQLQYSARRQDGTEQTPRGRPTQRTHDGEWSTMHHLLLRSKRMEDGRHPHHPSKRRRDIGR
jgi:hypothetical protein